MEISVNADNEKYFDELKAFAGISGTSVSNIISNLVRTRVKTPIILDPPWDLSNYTKDELINLNRLICELQQEIVHAISKHNK